MFGNAKMFQNRQKLLLKILKEEIWEKKMFFSTKFLLLLNGLFFNGRDTFHNL